MSPVFSAKIQSGRLLVDQRPEWEGWLWSLEGRDDIDVIVCPRELRRTLTQNAYYHVVIELIADYIGETHKGAHRLMKQTFLPLGVSSTAKLTKRQFRAYLEDVVLWAVGWLGVRIPPRDRVHIPEVAA